MTILGVIKDTFDPHKSVLRNVLTSGVRITKGVLFLLITTAMLTLLYGALKHEVEALKYAKVIESGYRTWTTEEIAKRMRYQGTLTAYQDENHVWKFLNKDGVECNLFPKGE